MRRRSHKGAHEVFMGDPTPVCIKCEEYVGDESYLQLQDGRAICYADASKVPPEDLERPASRAEVQDAIASIMKASQ